MAGKNHFFPKAVLSLIVAFLLVGVVKVGSRQGDVLQSTQAASAQAISCLRPANAHRAGTLHGV
jgi:hypothetical protein